MTIAFGTTSAVAVAVALAAEPNDCTVAGITLEPIEPQLEKLKWTTAEHLPPWNPNVRSKSHIQLVRERLLPVAEHIMSHLQTLKATERGSVEMSLCKHIAMHSWPLPALPHTPDHLRVHEMYRNTLCRLAMRPATPVRIVPGPSSVKAHVKQDPQHDTQHAEETPDMQSKQRSWIDKVSEKVYPVKSAASEAALEVKKRALDFLPGNSPSKDSKGRDRAMHVDEVAKD